MISPPNTSSSKENNKRFPRMTKVNQLRILNLTKPLKYLAYLAMSITCINFQRVSPFHIQLIAHFEGAKKIIHLLSHRVKKLIFQKISEMKTKYLE